MLAVVVVVVVVAVVVVAVTHLPMGMEWEEVEGGEAPIPSPLLRAGQQQERCQAPPKDDFKKHKR